MSLPVHNFLFKPSSHLCNIDCTYCFYKRVKDMYPAGRKMSVQTAQAVMDQILSQGPGRYSFCWQGGEPTLLGLDFFRTVLVYQKKISAPGQFIENSIQTNGLVLNDDWASFLSRNRILVGLSLDGPREIHDQFRIKNSGGGTFDQVMDKAVLLSKHGADFNILTLLTRANIHQPETLYAFYKKHGFKHLQFVPCTDKDLEGQALPWSITGRELGDFYRRLFDLWIKDGFPHVSIRLFEDILIYMLDGVHMSCSQLKHCDSYLVVEHNGDCYPCDFFVYPEWNLGNLADDQIERIIDNPARHKFAGLKTVLSSECRKCEWLNFCNGDCTRLRPGAPDFPGRQSDLCQAWKTILDHIYNHPAGVREMAMKARNEYQPPAPVKVGRNDPCPCGSGKKYKKCCLGKTQ